MGDGTTSMVTRAELRRRWGSLLTVAVLVAVVSGAVMSAVVGADRTASAVDRFRSTTRAADLWYQTNDDQNATEMLAAATRDPAVESASLRYLANIWPTNGSTDMAVMGDLDGAYGRTIDRPYLLSGRMPTPDSADEVVLNEQAAQLSGLEVGDRLRARTWSRQDLAGLDGDNFPGFNGPELDLTVVGIGRMPDELTGDLRRTSPYAIASSAFLAKHPDLGVWPPSVEARLRPGADHNRLDATMSRLQTEAAAQSAGTPGDFWISALTASDIYLDAMRTATRSLVIGLLLFAAAALASGGLAIAQAVRRQLGGSVTSSATLSTLGMTRSEIARTRSRPIGLAATVGSLGGVAIAVAASPLLPIGLVARAETEPGVRVAPQWLVIVATTTVIAAWGLANMSIRGGSRRGSGAAGLRRAPWSARLAARSGAAPAVATGLRLAGDRSRGSVPVRSAFIGVAICVAGVVGAGVIRSSYHDLSATPTRWGQPWSSIPDYTGDGTVDTIMDDLVKEDRIDAVATLISTSLVLDKQVVSTSGLDAVKGAMAFTALDGRLPRSPTEISLGTATAKDLGVSVGDTVTATAPDGSRVPLTVVGTVVLPATDNQYAVDVGAVATTEGIDRAGNTSDITRAPVIHFAPGIDVRRTEAELSKSIDGLEFNVFTDPRPPGIVSSLAEPRDIATWLAMFLTLIAVIGMLHVLVVSTRRRQGELGVLRALGLRGRQVQRAVTVQALALTGAGLAVGIPIGFVAGRWMWRSLVAQMGAASQPSLPLALLTLIVPVAGAVTVCLSWLPARNARRRSPAASLRAE